MAASANPSQEGGKGTSAAPNGQGNPSANPPTENSIPSQVLKHDPGIVVDWTPDEQSILEDCLSKYGTESNIVRYAKIATHLKDKTVRDVALRCKWMSRKETSKRRKIEGYNLSRKNKEKKEKNNDASKPSSIRQNIPSYAMPMLPMDNDDDISYEAIGGATGQLLEQNAQFFNQITSNLTSFQIQENIGLFCHTRDNILTILKDLNDLKSDVMKQMPPLPVKVNVELASSILPPTTLPMPP